MTHHFLNDSETHVGWDRSFPPRVIIDSGDEVTFDCHEGAGGQVTSKTTSADLPSIDRSRIHTLTGPVFINGAEPGDVLEVEPLDFQHKGFGFTYLTPGGLLIDEFPEPYLHQWIVDDGGCHFNDSIVVPYEPFCGTMGVAPRQEGTLVTYPPRENGGNMDIRGLGIGSKLWLPVWTPGALFSTGDCHGAQGDGEICGTAIECPMTVTMRFNLIKGWSIPEPRLQTPSPLTIVDTAGYYVTTGHGENLLENARTAVRYMIEYLVERSDLSREEAYVLCSAAVDLKISNAVCLPNRIVSAYLPLSIFKS
jgi:acetamidase/formamidase